MSSNWKVQQKQERTVLCLSKMYSFLFFMWSPQICKCTNKKPLFMWQLFSGYFYECYNSYLILSRGDRQIFKGGILLFVIEKRIIKAFYCILRPRLEDHESRRLGDTGAFFTHAHRHGHMKIQNLSFSSKEERNARISWPIGVSALWVPGPRCSPAPAPLEMQAAECTYCVWIKIKLATGRRVFLYHVLI